MIKDRCPTGIVHHNRSLFVIVCHHWSVADAGNYNATFVHVIYNALDKWGSQEGLGFCSDCNLNRGVKEYLEKNVSGLTSIAHWGLLSYSSSPPTASFTSSITSAGAPARGLHSVVNTATNWILLDAKWLESFKAMISQRIAREAITPDWAMSTLDCAKKYERTTIHAYMTAIFLSLAYFMTKGRTIAKLMSEAVSCLLSCGESIVHYKAE